MISFPVTGVEGVSWNGGVGELFEIYRYLGCDTASIPLSIGYVNIAQPTGQFAKYSGKTRYLRVFNGELSIGVGNDSVSLAETKTCSFSADIPATFALSSPNASVIEILYDDRGVKTLIDTNLEPVDEANPCEWESKNPENWDTTEKVIEFISCLDGELVVNGDENIGIVHLGELHSLVLLRDPLESKDRELLQLRITGNGHFLSGSIFIDETP